MRTRKAFFLVLLLWTPAIANAQTSVVEASEKALKRSKLTQPGSKPFHLIAHLKEKDSPDSGYQATVEMFWASPIKWRRIITSERFSQVRIVSGDKVFEQNTGDYFPIWISNMLTSLFDPLPMLAAIQREGAESPQSVEMPASGSESCVYLGWRIDRWSICFQSDGLFSSVTTKGYAAIFRKYEKFGDKKVPRLIENDPEPGTHLETRVATLEEFNSSEEKMFEIDKPTPLAEQIKSVRVSDDIIRQAALNSAEIDWPTVGEGLLTGGCAVYVSADREGHIREAWPGGCDNAALEGPLREAMLKWKLKPALSNGNPVQLESLMGFTFHTQLDSGKLPPLLTNEQARSLASHIVEPDFPPGSGPAGTVIEAQISVDETGKFTGVRNTHHLNGPVLLAISAVLQKWQFRPYLKDGKPQYFHADVSFRLK